MAEPDSDTSGKGPDERALDLLRRSSTADAGGQASDGAHSAPAGGPAGPKVSVVILPAHPSAPSEDMDVRPPPAHHAKASAWHSPVEALERNVVRAATAWKGLATRASAVSRRWRLWTPASLFTATVIIATAVPSTTLFDLDLDDPAAEATATGTHGIAGARSPPPPPATGTPNRGSGEPAGSTGQSGTPPGAKDGTPVVVPLQPRDTSVESRPREATARNGLATDARPRSAPPLDGTGGASMRQSNERPPADRGRAASSEEGKGDDPPGATRGVAAGDKGTTEGGGAPNAPQIATGGSSRAGTASGPGAAGTGSDAGQRGAAGGSAASPASPGGSPGQESRPSDPAMPEECRAEAPKEPVVLVFDGSISMGLPLDMPLDLEAELDRRMADGDNDARLEYRRWLAMELPKRVGTAKSAVSVMLAEADPKLQIGAVAFTGCLEIETQPFVPYEGRSQIGAFIADVTPRRGGATPLTASVEAALRLIDGGDAGGRARIVVMTDGQETCGGDLCALAAATAKNRPGVRVDVIDMSGRSNAACLAEATGGLMVNHAGVRGRISLSSLLVRTANQCAASAKNMESQRQ